MKLASFFLGLSVWLTGGGGGIADIMLSVSAKATTTDGARTFRPISSSWRLQSPTAAKPTTSIRSSGSRSRALQLTTWLRGGDTDRRLMDVDYDNLVEASFEWLCNLGAPAALVAGAVVATLYENMHSGDLKIHSRDRPRVQLLKKVTKLLLLWAFALEVFSIFITTVTGSVLLSTDMNEMDLRSGTPLGFLRDNFEFEYLAARISYLQGLWNWLAAIALSYVLPTTDDHSVDRIDIFIATSLGTLIVLMMSFFNCHTIYYKNYFTLLMRFFVVTLERFFKFYRPLEHPLSFALIPMLAATFFTGYRALAPSKTTVGEVSEKGQDGRVRRRFGIL